MCTVSQGAAGFWTVIDVPSENVQVFTRTQHDTTSVDCLHSRKRSLKTQTLHFGALVVY